DGTWRVTSDVPIIAYQFNPLIQGAASSDASMLYPVASWDYYNHVVHWGEGYGRGYITIVAANDGTVVEVTPVVATAGGNGVPAGSPNVPFQVMLNEGELAEVAVVTQHEQLTGTKVISDEDHPVAVFSGHECAWIPLGMVACDHIEEQLAGVRLWGTNFAAGRVPVRRPANPETSLWQIVASEDGTTVTITADAGVTGVPPTPAVLNQGEKLQFFAGGTPQHPGDLLIEADKPIAVANYMTGFGNLGGGNDGDPAMVQLAPYEQFLPRYVVLVPSTWINDVAVVARAAGAVIELDGTPIADNLFIPVANSGYEVARVPVTDGIHVLDGDQNAFSVIIIGFDQWDSYAYLGGTGTGVINPNPVG
ncbi:MAG: IgGFc-binding protein, partial [Myxococcales bacterium]|nr:IgGFc-binding protein [Myxococcales bacterium]